MMTMVATMAVVTAGSILLALNLIWAEKRKSVTTTAEKRVVAESANSLKVRNSETRFSVSRWSPNQGSLLNIEPAKVLSGRLAS